MNAQRGPQSGRSYVKVNGLESKLDCHFHRCRRPGIKVNGLESKWAVMSR